MLMKDPGAVKNDKIESTIYCADVSTDRVSYIHYSQSGRAGPLELGLSPPPTCGGKTNTREGPTQPRHLNLNLIEVDQRN